MLANKVGRSPRPPTAGEAVGPYRIARQLGAGGEGLTFAAVDTRAGTAAREPTLAVKLFSSGANARSPQALERRVRLEFERLAGLSHPSLVRTLDVGRHQDVPFLVTELVPGPSLTALAANRDVAQRRGRFERAAADLADALAYLHARGFVHGDVSPENVRFAADGITPVLLDVGGAVAAVAGAAFGTLGYAAPEALVGAVGPASDLFGLGASLFAAWTGAAPFGVGAESVARMMSPSARVPVLSATAPGLSPSWDELLAALLERAPGDRPSSAREVLRRIRRAAPGAGPSAPDAELLPPYPAGDPLDGLFVGRADERTVLAEALRDLRGAAAPFGVVALVGAEGAGRRCLIDQALREFAVAGLAGASSAAGPTEIVRGTLAALARWATPAAPSFAVADDPERAAHDRYARLVRAIEARAAERPVCVVLEPERDGFSTGGDGGAVADFADFVAGAPPSGRWLLICASPRPIARIGARDVEVGPLAQEDLVGLIERAAGERPRDDVVGRLWQASGGHAATACHLARQLVLALRGGTAGTFVPAQEAGLGERLTALFSALSRAARRALACAVLGLSPSGSSAGPALDEARIAGWLADVTAPDDDDSRARLPRLRSGSHEAAVATALGAPDLRDLVMTAIDTLPAGDSRRGWALAAIGRAEEASAVFRAAAAEAARDDGRRDSGEDGRWLQRAFRLSPSSLTIAERIRLADRLVVEGAAAEAEDVLHVEPGETTGPGQGAASRLRLDERRAWLRARAGDLDGARTILMDALNAAPSASDEDRALVRARLARVLFGARRYDEAVATATPAFADAHAGALAVESALLARAYGGDLAAARDLLAALPGAARTSARGLVLAALLDHLAGDLEAALRGYVTALAAADRTCDIHTAGAIALNIGALAAESGRYGEALAALDRAIRDLGRIGSTAELGTALFNAGMLLAELGDLGGARRTADRLRGELALRASGAGPGAASYVDAEILARQGDDAAALEQLLALAGNRDVGSSRLQRAAALSAADLLAGAGRTDEATALIDRLIASPPPSELSATDGAMDGEADVRLARARVLLMTKVWDIDAVAVLAERLAADAARASAETRRPAAFRAGLAAARLFHRIGRTADAAPCLASARQSFEEVRMATPPDHRPGLERDPDAHLLAELVSLAARDGGRGPSDGEAIVRASRTEGRLRRLLRINKRLNSELRLSRLLELIMDTVIELTEAERGFVLLEDDKGELAVKVARNIDQQSLDAGALELSRSIAHQAVQGGVPIVTVDAAGDPRFREAMSVSDLHLRSVLAVPLLVKGKAVGTVYVDHRLRQGAFSPDDVQLVLDFTEQAAIAIENARLMSELRKREKKIDGLNQRLQGELAARKEELSGMKQELRESREALAIRYDYRNIVGRTPRMLELFRLLDRLTDTALPVVIQGESGTGKELVARALHFNGPRRAQPFVSENCAAIPETLLESTLFGAVRGAFTGADHDSRGLFEIADGGTLFLDEVGEMSAGMQGKLLRILQTGELRRVGSERTRKVDVRIIAATNRDLGRMVEEGKFRQDLFFRLSVARIGLPPLRERRDDIPAIVEHLLGTMAATGGAASGGERVPPKRIEPVALARLCAYRWPGNVRELENEIMRAVALSGETIGVEDLSAHVAGGAEASLTAIEDADNLGLKPRVERLERALLREALSRHGGNQTKAAEALGLSRFGLQKKLRRYGFS